MIRSITIAAVVVLAGCAGAHTSGARSQIEPVLASWPNSGAPRQVQLESHAVKVARGDTSIGLLEAEGIVANADAIEIVRALNPSVDVYDLTPGATLRLPRLAQASSGPVELRIDEQRKHALSDQIANVEQAWMRAKDGAGSLQTPEVLHASEEVAKTFAAIRERLDKRSLVTTTQFLQVVNIEAERFGAVVPGLATAPASEPDRKLVAQLASDLGAQTRTFIDQHKGDHPLPAELVTIEVKVKKQTRDGTSQVDGYRVWYVPMIAFRPGGEGFPLVENAPPHSTLPPGLYALWVTPATAPTPRLGLVESVLVLPSPGQPVTMIELAVEAAKP